MAEARGIQKAVDFARCAGTVTRYMFNYPLIWADELVALFFLWLPVWALGHPFIISRSVVEGVATATQEASA